MPTDLELWSTSGVAISNGFDLDQDPENNNDVGLGVAIYMVRSGALGLTSPISSAPLEDGRLIWLLEVEECVGADNPYARVGFHEGRDEDDDPLNNLEPDARLEIVDRIGPPAVGTKTQGRMLVTEGTAVVPLSIFLDAPGHAEPIDWVRGLAFATELVWEPDGSLSGRLGIGLDRRAGEVYLSSLIRLVERLTADDPGCPSACETSAGQSAYRVFDRNDDGEITEDEILTSPASELGRHPTVDLTAEYDGEQVYWPRRDGQYDHHAFNLGFRAVPVGD